MANTLDPMDLKQIITLHLDGLSNRKISELIDISCNTINTYMKLFKASDKAQLICTTHNTRFLDLTKFRKDLFFC